jgi:hypothetical protein
VLQQLRVLVLVLTQLLLLLDLLVVPASARFLRFFPAVAAAFSRLATPLATPLT